MKTGQAPSPTRWALAAVLCAALFAVLTALVVARHGAPYALDESLHRWSVEHRPAVAVAFARGVTATGSGPVPYVCAVAAGLIAGRGTRGRVWAAAGALGFLLLVQAVRHAVLNGAGRARAPGWDRGGPPRGVGVPTRHPHPAAVVGRGLG
ncbi:hypothetical protein ACFVYT_37530, partial [Streptomyces sp. NPDC058290]